MCDPGVAGTVRVGPAQGGRAVLENTVIECHKRHRTDDVLGQNSRRTAVQRDEDMVGIAALSDHVAPEAKTSR